MPKDRKTADEYPKLNENDKRWKEQEEFDTAGPQRELEDEEKNRSIAETSKGGEE